MLERRAHALALDALDEGGGHFAGQIGVFGEVFEVAAAQRRALHVGSGAEDNAHTLGNGLLGQRLPHLAQQGHVPTGGGGRGGGEAGRRQALADHGVGIGLAAQAVRPIGHK